MPPFMHLIKSIPVNGTYEIIRGDGNNLVGLDDSSTSLGLHAIINSDNNLMLNG